MSITERAQELIRSVEAGRSEDAMIAFYTGDFAMAENPLEPTVVRERLIQEPAPSAALSCPAEYAAGSPA